MSEAADLERRYRRWLRWYPRSFRDAHESEILEVLLAGAREGRRRPEPMECLDLVRAALSVRLRPRIPRSNRSARGAVGLMYLSAAAELATAIVVLATIDDVRSAIAARDPAYTAAQWRAELSGALHPLAVGAVVAAGLCLWLAWAGGRGHRWARAAFVLFTGLNVAHLIHGLIQGSAVYAEADLTAGLVLCLVQLAAVVLLLHAGPAGLG
ncbi:hypothetical protein AB0C14_02780 [Microbispora hainanensis]|uniref:hypothetical protein n=1 Tax=Microbispora hainanensis TaxID=568844 RepID=UPI0033E73595